MKNIITITLLIFSSQTLFSQYSSIFGSSSTSWNILKKEDPYIGVDSLVVRGDTLINSKTYAKVDLYSINSTSTFLHPSHYLIREDSTVGKAWFRELYNPYEVQILNMSLNLNDTMNFTSNTFAVVDSVYFLSGKKVLRLGWFPHNTCYEISSEPFTMEEGVGLIHNMQLVLGTGYCNYLLCKRKNGTLIYQNRSNAYSGYCNSNLLEVDENTLQNNFIIYPNPTTNNITILSKENMMSEISILDVFGNQIKVISSNSDTENIDISFLPKGIYFFKIHSNEKVITKRFIKQ
tara:strand:+ start:185 stop:1057 length:873 start_codon:yes stop_codon:yes gene_type:complete